MKRNYQSASRKQQAQETKNKILSATNNLLISNNYNEITISQIATMAGVAIPTVYALYKSKAGILKALLDSATKPDEFEQLVIQTKAARTLTEKLTQAAEMTAKIYAAEKDLLNTLAGLANYSEDLSKLQQDLERRRYTRQEETIKILLKHKETSPELDLIHARDIFWAFTSRDFYRLFVIERGWEPKEFIEFLSQILVLIFQNAEVKHKT